MSSANGFYLCQLIKFQKNLNKEKIYLPICYVNIPVYYTNTPGKQVAGSQKNPI